jgi:hypothetical protein
MGTEQERSGAGEVPENTAPDVTAAPGTAEELPPVQGVHMPDDGPGGSDIDTAERPVPGRERAR